MAIRTKQLCAVEVSGAGDTFLYETPPGYTTIIKEVLIWNTGGGLNSVAIILEASGGSRLSMFRSTTVGVDDTYQWDGWAVMGPGDRILFNGPYGAVTVWASGSELLGEAE